MREVVVELVRYVENGETGPCLARAQQTFGPEALRLACIVLLDWLKLRARLNIQRPLILVKSYDWSSTLQRLVSEVPEVSEVFNVDPEKVTFDSEVSSEERLEIQEFVHRQYNPPLRT